MASLEANSSSSTFEATLHYNLTPSDCGGNFTQSYRITWTETVFWCEGVLTVIVGSVGLLGNVFSILVLSTKQMRRYSFNYLLIALAVYDLLYIVCALPVYAIPALDVPALHNLTQYWFFGVLYKYFLYPFNTVAYSGGVYMTLAITIERYVAVCQPTAYRSALNHTTPHMRAVKYLVPVVVCSILFNIPKFLEVDVIYVNETYHFTMSDLRSDPTYHKWYTHSTILHPLLTTTIAPTVLLCFFNFTIYRAIVRSRSHVQHSHQHGEMNLATVLVILCGLFICCHSLRVVLGIQAFFRAKQTSACMSAGLNYLPPLQLLMMESFSHLLTLTNASCNFLVYCFHSTQFKVFFRKIVAKPIHQGQFDSFSRSERYSGITIQLRPLGPATQVADRASSIGQHGSDEAVRAVREEHELSTVSGSTYSVRDYDAASSTCTSGSSKSMSESRERQQQRQQQQFERPDERRRPEERARRCMNGAIFSQERIQGVAQGSAHYSRKNNKVHFSSNRVIPTERDKNIL